MANPLQKALEYRPKWFYKKTRGRPIFSFQSYNKVHGSYAMQTAHEQLSPEAKQCIVIAPFVYVPPVKSTEELREIVKKFAEQHPHTDRIFIRGNPTASVIEPISSRWARWNWAPRGHFHVDRNSFQWDARIDDGRFPKKDEPHHWRTTEWLLYPTRKQSEMHDEGMLEFYSNKKGEVIIRWSEDYTTHKRAHNVITIDKNGNIHFVLPIDKTPLLQKNHKAIIEFVKKLAILPKVKRARKTARQMRFVRWKNEPHKLEFYDLL